MAGLVLMTAGTDRNRFIVAVDRQRFLVSNVLDEEAKSLIVVLNWNAGLKR